MKTKQDRVDACNRLLAEIGKVGRGFFQTNVPRAGDGQAKFELRRGHVYFVDDYSGKAIYTAHTRDDWRGFSHGGTLRDLVIALSRFIRTGSTIAPSYFGPWPAWYCGGDLWGYGSDMVKVRRAAVNNGIVHFDHAVHRIEYTRDSAEGVL